MEVELENQALTLEISMGFLDFILDHHSLLDTLKTFSNSSLAGEILSVASWMMTMMISSVVDLEVEVKEVPRNNSRLKNDEWTHSLIWGDSEDLAVALAFQALALMMMISFLEGEMASLVEEPQSKHRL